MFFPLNSPWGRCPLARADFLDSVVAAEDASFLRSQNIPDLVPCPDVECAFRVLWAPVSKEAVRVFGGEKAAVRVPHVSQDIFKRFTGDLRKKLFAGQLPGFGKRDGQLGLIVEHFLKMRHVPKSIHRIAVKSAAEVIAHSSCGHLAQCKRAIVAARGASSPWGVAKRKRKFITEVWGIWALRQSRHIPRQKRGKSLRIRAGAASHPS